jgi:hypothetical protein
VLDDFVRRRTSPQPLLKVAAFEQLEHQIAMAARVLAGRVLTEVVAKVMTENSGLPFTARRVVERVERRDLLPGRRTG